MMNMNEIVIALLTAFIGGLIGTYLGALFMNNREERKLKKVRAVAVKALRIIKKYSKQSYRNAENDFNTSLSVPEKRMVIVALHKLGLPIEIPTNEVFDIRRVFFVDKIIDKEELDRIANHIETGYCDKLFYLDPESYFAANNTIFAMRNAGKKYVKEILSKAEVDPDTKIIKEAISDINRLFTLGEFKAIQVLREQVRDQMYFDDKGRPIQEKLETLIKDIDIGLWDSYLMWNYESYLSVKAQIQMGTMLLTAPVKVETTERTGGE